MAIINLKKNKQNEPYFAILIKIEPFYAIHVPSWCSEGHKSSRENLIPRSVAGSRRRRTQLSYAPQNRNTTIPSLHLPVLCSLVQKKSE